MKKTAALLAVLMILTAAANAFAEFTFREGITWNMSKQDVRKCLRTEDGYEAYEIYDDEQEDIKAFLEQYSAKEKTNPQLWMVTVRNAFLYNPEDETIISMIGTNAQGLYTIACQIRPGSQEDGEWYRCATEICRRLSEQYGGLTVEDRWEQREELETRSTVYQGYLQTEDGTLIDLYMKKYMGEYGLYLEMHSPRAIQIVRDIVSGALYEETSSDDQP